MNLINLKDAPLVEKAEAGATLFTLNPDGTINRISAENVGGAGSGNVETAPTATITMVWSGDISLLSEPLSGTTNDMPIAGYCDDMTFAEAKEYLMNGELLDVKLHWDFGDAMVGICRPCYILYDPESESIVMTAIMYDQSFHVQWANDDAITVTA